MLARRTLLLTPPKVDPRLPRFAQFSCNISPFRINTCKSVSKQTTLTPFRMNTYEKHTGWGRGTFSSSSNLSRATCHETQVLFLHSLAHSFALFCAFLHRSKVQLFYFQAVPHSTSKNAL